jgi:hypothetical protein
LGRSDWDCVDLAKVVIRVEHSYDPKEKTFIDVKGTAGNRNVPIAAVLRDYSLDHKITADREEDLVFGRTPELPTPRQQHAQPRRHALGKGQAHPDRFHEAHPYLRVADDRRWSHRESDLDPHGPREREDHARHLWAPDAQQRGRGRRAPRRIPSARQLRAAPAERISADHSGERDTPRKAAIGSTMRVSAQPR